MQNRQNDIRPPQWSLLLLRLFVREHFLEEIEGDMEEVFMDDLDQYSIKKAKWKYVLGVFKLMRPSLTRLLSGSQKLNYLGMIQHNLLITLRGFKRHKTSFFINLIGLSTGLAASLLIFLWVNDERSVDTFHEKNDQLYWVFANFQLPNSITTWNYTSGLMGKSMKQDFPEVEEAVTIGNTGFFKPKGIVSNGESNFELDGLFASKNFFDILTYPLLIGNQENILEDNESIVLSESMAMAMFGNLESALGATVEWENQFFNKTFIISGIFQSPPKNATNQFDAVINYDLLVQTDQWAAEWNGGYAQNFLVLRKGTDIEEFNAKIENYMDDKINNDRFTLFVQPYAKNYLYGEYDNGVQVGGRIENVRLFTIIAIFILLIACINFMNLSTAQASKKMKEVGVKKAIGANKGSLIFQFLVESILLASLAVIVAIILVNVLLPQFNEITSKELEINIIDFILPLIGITLITGFLAGSYPAFYLSGFKPVAVLKGKISNLRGEEWIRKGLVITQFVLSIVFIIGVITINRQIEFTQSKDLGYNRENIVTFARKGQINENAQVMLAELQKIPGIESIANMAGDFLWGEDSGSGYSWDPSSKDDDNHLFKSPKIGYNIIETLGIEVIEGRSFSKEFMDDKTKVIINESAVKLMGIKEPIGTILDYGSGGTREIIGVVKDFQYGSMHQQIEPLLFRFREEGRNFVVKIQTGTEAATLQQIEDIYTQFHPKYDFNPTYLQDDYKALYSTESKVAILANYMAIIAILVSCLGLFGLAAFTAERRSKEIGIRKILGASHLVIMKILTGSFTKTVLISVLFALPLGYILANNWLNNFAYTIQLEWWIFALAGLTALLIAWITVSFQTFKAALVNPVECLRNE
ncbi:ABC transporter permease [Roseivirga misakiensis]|nr:ABC transporter permease [Roseivirga misakiensis]